MRAEGNGRGLICDTIQ